MEPADFLVIIIWRYTREQLVASRNCRLACGNEEKREHAGNVKAEQGWEEWREKKKKKKGREAACMWERYIQAGSGRNWNRDERNDEMATRYGDETRVGQGGANEGIRSTIARNSRFARFRASAETAICIGNYTGWITPRNERSVLRVIGAHYKSRDVQIAPHTSVPRGSWTMISLSRSFFSVGHSFPLDFCWKSFRDNLSSRFILDVDVESGNREI